MNNNIRVGITHGDTNGIGYEIILKTLAEPMFGELCTPVVYGSSKIANVWRKILHLEPVPFNIVKSAEEIKQGQNNLIEVIDFDVQIEPGVESKQAGKAAFTSLERAVEDLKRGLIDVLVTAPINKHAIQSEEFPFPGHTEYLEAAYGDGEKSLMILYNDMVKVALVTTHLPIANIPAAVTKEAILEKLSILNHTLVKDFSLDCPRIAVLSLNPHAGENGLLGTEEQQVIIPSIQEANDNKILCFGPYAADGFFGSGLYTHFDAVLAMYHDQGLTAFKTIAMDSGVNYTAGLPFIRTSPDHGTGFDIAGKGLAKTESFREAIYEAIDIFRSRARYRYAHRNPLRKVYRDRGRDNEVLDLTKDE